LQVQATEKAMLAMIDFGIKNDIRLSVSWFGPFIPTVWCYRPESIKAVLKGTFNYSYAS